MSFPSFSSFPDLEPGPSQKTVPSEHKKRDKKRDETRSRKETKDSAKTSSKHKSSEDKHEHSKHRKRERSVTDSDLHGHATDDYKKTRTDEDHQQWRPFELEQLTDVTSRPVYYSDRKGDVLNVKYGRIHAGDIPKYTLLGRGRKILGLSDAFTVVYRGRHGLEIDVGRKRKLPALTDSRSRHLLRAPPTKRYIASSESKYKYSEVEGFLRLPDTSKRKITHQTRDISVVVEDPERSESSSSDEEEADSDDSDATPLTSHQATLKALETQLSENPTSIPTWLSLLSHTLSSIPPDSKNARKARAEIALSVLSRALAAHPDNAQSLELRLKYIHAGEEIWTGDALESEWEKALKYGRTELWVRWLDWRIRVSSKGVEGIVEDVQRALSSLEPQDENGRLRVFWRTAIAFRDAGFVERANAMFQAEAELVFRRPSHLQEAPFTAVLDGLEEFWDSEVSRAGEIDSTGWAAWEAAGRPDVQDSTATPTTYKPTASDPYVRWALYELSPSRPVRSLPARNTSDDPDSDPYATILFSDIRPLLLDLPSLNAKQKFRLIWLSFLGVHIPGLSASIHDQPLINTDDRWSAAHYASPEFLSSLFPSKTHARQITADAHAGVLVGREREYSGIFGPVKHWSYSLFDPLESIASERQTMLTREDLAGADAALVREVFRQCRASASDPEWDTLHLAFEGALDLKAALKLSKTYLAAAQDSLQHWATHARLERLRGRPNDARKVYTTVLPSVSSEKAGAGALWWDWAEMEWRSQSKEAATQVILRSTSTAGSGTVALLRCKRSLDELINSVPAEHWGDRQAWVKLRALLEILTTSIASGISILDSHLGTLAEGSLPHESLTVISLTMLYVYGTILRNPLPPALLRERAEAAIVAYPSNTVVLGLFLEAEKGQAVWGKVHLILGENTAAGVQREKDLPRRVAGVWAAGWEKGRWRAEEERTRAGLSAAAQDERTRHSAILWRIYLEFEIRAGQLDRAKKLLFRAIGECPLAKELYLIGFLQLRSVFNVRGLKELAETMAERGIRLRAGLDEALADWAEPAAPQASMEVEDVGDDDIEYNAQEFRRLRPY